MPAESIQGKPLPRTLCNTTATLKTAIDALRPCSHIVCDLEGRSLGAVGGKLSLITLCAVPSADVPEPHIYLVDAIALSARALQPLYELLRSEAHTKVMFDARSDWSELFHRCGVELARVLDVQLADVDSRASRGETVEQQLARLSPYCSAEHVRKERQCYAQVHRLNSLEACVTEHDIVRRSERVKSKNFAHDQWCARPLGKKHSRYAALDVYLIGRLYRDFVQKNYIDEAKLLGQSARYMTIHRNGPKPVNSGHALLPLEVLEDSPAGKRVVCKTCSRSLAVSCFSNAARKAASRKDCWVCRAVNVRKDAAKRLQPQPQPQARCGTSGAMRPGPSWSTALELPVRWEHDSGRVYSVYPALDNYDDDISWSRYVGYFSNK